MITFTEVFDYVHSDAPNEEGLFQRNTCRPGGRRRRLIFLIGLTVVVLGLITIGYWSSYVLYWFFSEVKSMIVRILSLVLIIVTVACTGPSPETDTVSKQGLTDISGIEDLRSAFQDNPGIPRLVLLVSPTWPVCVAGARWVQEQILEQNQDADLRVFAVWFEKFPGDSRSNWPPTLLSDSRVLQYWDEEKKVGRWYEVNVTKLGGEEKDRIEWDAYFLYDTDAQWEDLPPKLNSWGRTIMASREKMKSDLLKLIVESSNE